MVGVIELIWSDPAPPCEECRYDHCFAETPFGRLTIEWKSWKEDGDGYVCIFKMAPDSNAICEYSLEEAKAAVQKKWDSIILSLVKRSETEFDKKLVSEIRERHDIVQTSLLLGGVGYVNQFDGTPAHADRLTLLEMVESALCLTVPKNS